MGGWHDHETWMWQGGYGWAGWLFAAVVGIVFVALIVTTIMLAVRYLGERQVIRPLDPDFAEVLARLEALSVGDITRLSSDEAGRRWVVGFNDDRDPGATYLYDHSSGQSRLLYRPLPHLAPESMAPMRPVTIPSRDGLALHSYLTLPVGVEPDKLPLVLVVHGGPWYRDSWGFDAGVQMLANRGYAVLQVNFRGSTGYGKAFLKAAIGEFAGKMHDDLIDATQWAIDEGIAIPDKVAIMGGSYGGYATLVGLTYTPDTFACGVDIVGPSNLETLLSTIPPYWAPVVAQFHERMGNPNTPEGKQLLIDASPLYKADEIIRPLLIGQGANDPRVNQAESDQIVEAMKEKGIPVTYVLFPDEGHGFARPENNIAFNAVTENFLATCLGGRAEPIKDTLQASTAEIVEGEDFVQGLAQAVD